jgi:hypothetical protein
MGVLREHLQRLQGDTAKHVLGILGAASAPVEAERIQLTALARPDF